MASLLTPPVKRQPAKVADIDRALGPTENIYYLLDKLYCLNFVVYAQIDGSFDTGRLAGALRAVQAEHPLLRARVALAGGRPWFKPVAADAHPIPIESGGLRNWRARIEAQLERPFVDATVLARFLVFGTGARKSVVAMVFHHAIADGRSGADVLIEVLRRAGGEDMPLNPRPAQPSAQALDLVKLGGRIGASMRTLGYWLQQGKSVLKLARQLPGYDMAVRAERRIRVVPFTLPKAKARALLQACRAHGVTMQGALGAAQLLAINSEFGVARSRNLGLNSLADLRGLLGGNLTQQDLGLYIATVTTVHAIAAEPEFWALAADVRNQLKAVLDSGDANLVHTIHREGALYPPNPVGARMVQGLVALAAPSSMLTNVGRFEPVTLAHGATLGALGFLVSPPAQHPICVTVSSLGEGMHLNLLFDECKVDAAQARRLAAAMAERLVLAARA
jgi:Condensation domain